MTRLYIKTTSDGLVIDGYSSLFRKPADGDTCIAEADYLIHFEIDGEINPPLSNQNGNPLYKLVDGKVVRRTEEEITGNLSVK